MWLAAAVIAASAGCRYGYDAVDVAPDGGSIPGDPDAGEPGDAGGPIDARPPPQRLAFGRGTSGALELAQGELQVNEYAAVEGEVARESTSLTIDRTLVARTGALVLIWQTGTTAPTASGDQSNIVLDASDIGQWELVRLSADLDGTKVELEQPTRNAYAAGTTQLVTVPEYTTAFIGADAKVYARAWDGRIGGVVAFLVADKLELEGRIDATGAGYRGGVASLQGNEDLNQCNDLDEPPPGSEAKGEGAAMGRYGQETTGRGNLANGGGGGPCHNGGGGGGGHQGAGGQGGVVEYESFNAAPALGGAATIASSNARLSMGGGGGAGESHHSGPSHGAAGGGAILVGARAIAGGGAIEADGLAAPLTSNGDGAGGGGAGGAISILSDEFASCDHVSARGGDGGNSNEGSGGGGGGGGRIVAVTVPCVIAVEGGEPGNGLHRRVPSGGQAGAIFTLPAGGF